LVRRLVEAVELLDLLDLRRVNALAAAIAAQPGAAAVRPPASPPAMSRPWSCATICSTGPPGTNWMTMKVISRIPKSVGIMSSSRFRM